MLRWLLILVLLVGLPGAFVTGCKYRAGQDAATALKAEQHVVAVVQKDAAAGQQIAAKDAAAQVEIQWRTRTLHDEVPVYVTAQADRECVVPVGFVRLWNDASSGVPAAPDAAPGPDAAAASGVVLSDIGRAHVGDAGQYAAIAKKLSDLQDWERQVEADAASRPN